MQRHKTTKSKRGNRRVAVAEYLGVRMGEWVPGYEIASPDVGGSEGLRRIRELRERGFVIDNRPMRDSEAHEYRLVEVT